MGKVTIIIESNSTPTSELEKICYLIIDSADTQFHLPEDVEVYIVPDDE